MSNLEKISTLIPLEELEVEAQQQIFNVAALDFVKKIAIMPDCHTGYSMPIGGVALTDNVISPAWVGYDIGCGMCCIVTDEKASDIFKKRKDHEKFDKKIKSRIPFGFERREESLDIFSFKSASGNEDLDKKVLSRLGFQLGTLGGGNHFIELGVNNNDFLTITIHSGSRNAGHSVANFYINLSKTEDSSLPQGFFDIRSEFGKVYLEDLFVMQNYALENRKVMMGIVLESLGFSKNQIKQFIRDMINENHNHAILTENGILHRKGATPADLDQLGVIPGDMETGVIITSGLGNEEYLCSASHGAGRVLSRKKAKAKYSDPDEVKRVENRMRKNGIFATISKDVADEFHGAYKNLGMVIDRQKGIVINVIDVIKPIHNIKG